MFYILHLQRCPCLLPYDLSLAESNRDDLSAQAIGYSFRTHATDTLAKISYGAGKIFRKLKEVNATVRDTKDMKEVSTMQIYFSI